MTTFLDTLRAFMGTQDEKAAAKTRFLGLNASDDGWFEARDAFRTLDDRCEDLAAALVAAINECRANDQLEDALAALAVDEERALRAFIGGRGLDELLICTPKGLGELVKKYRRASFVFTAAQALNCLRGSCDDVAQWEELLEGDSPRENLDEGWDKAVELITAEYNRLAGTLDVDNEEIWREAAYNVERKTRKALDTVGEQLVDYMRNLVESGRFDHEASELDPEVKRHAYDLLRMVPQLQRQTETKPEPRPVAVLDRTDPQTDTEAELDTETETELN